MLHNKIERHIEEVFGQSYFDDKEKGEEVPSLDEMMEPSWSRMNFRNTNQRGNSYLQEENAFLLYMMFRHGYGAAEKIRMEIRRAWEFRFDWYFKSLNASELQRRCDEVVVLVEQEHETITRTKRENK